MEQVHLRWIFKKEIIFGYENTVWKFLDFSVIQILREINLGESRSAKFAIFTHLENANFDFYEILHFLKAEIDQNIEIQSLQN